jgi:hypothetical protein
MSRIRPLERRDLPAVADLYELVIRSGVAEAPPGLAAYFGRLTCDAPSSDPELPSLVYDEPGPGIVGFLASYPRPMVNGDHGGRPLRLACSGQLVAHPDFRSRGVGALLLRRYLAGPQDLTITDGATGEVRAIWERMGGVTHATASLGWTRSFAPVRQAAGRVAGHWGRQRVPGNVVLRTLDRVLGRRSQPPPPEATSEPLPTATLLEGLAALPRTFAVRPAYDEALLTWLFDEMAAVDARGPLVRRAVRRPDGALAGWYVAYVPPGDVAQVVQVAGTHPDLVLDELFHHLAAQGAAGVQGRVDPFLYPHLRQRRCRFQPTAWALLHARDPGLVAAVTTGRALLTRLEGEWWMGHHRLTAASLAP